MTSYFDSSALVAIYVTERFSAVARREARSAPQLPYTALHALEVPNALRVLHGRGLISSPQLREQVGQLADDLEAHQLLQTRIDLFAVFDRAIELSQVHAVRLLCRSLGPLPSSKARTILPRANARPRRLWSRTRSRPSAAFAHHWPACRQHAMSMTCHTCR